MIDLIELQNKCYKIAQEKGFFEPPLEDVSYHMMAVGELSEAVDEMRNDMLPIYSKDGKPQGELIEIADCILRLLSYCGHKGYNIEEAINIKMKYNETRPYKHGKKF